MDGDDGGFSMDFGSFMPGGGETAELEPLSDSFPFASTEGSAMSSGDADIGDTAFTADLPNGNYSESPSPQRKGSSKSKPAELKGDFNPKEIATGIRTVLERDKG